MPIARLRGIDLAYTLHGSTDSLPILLIHGHPFDRSMWDPQVKAFADHYRLVVPDLRGYGQTTIPNGVTLLDEVALDLAHLLDVIGITQAVVCGISMGGQIAMEFASLFPHRLLGLVLADTDARAETNESRAVRLAMADRLAREGMKGYTDEGLGNFLHEQTLREQPDVVAHMRRMMYEAPPLGAARLQRGRAERRDYSETLRSIRVPSLVVVGEADYFTPIQTAEHIHKQLPNSNLVVVESAGHMPNLEVPTVFNEALGELLECVSSSVPEAV